MGNRIPDFGQLSSFGASTVELGNVVAICGGVGGSALHHGQLVTFINVSSGYVSILGSSPLIAEDSEHCPIMIGSSALSDGQYVKVLGGGVTSFPSGTYWETRPSHFEIPQSLLRLESGDSGTKPLWHYVESPKIIGNPHRTLNRGSLQDKPKITPISRVKLNSKDEFEDMLRAGRPVIIDGSDIGPCVSKWTQEYMVDRVGPDIEVRILFLYKA